MHDKSQSEQDGLEILQRVSRRTQSRRRRLGSQAAKFRCLIALAALSVLDGVVSALVQEYTSADRVFSVIIGLGGVIVILFWCLYDARQRNYHINLFFRVLIVVFACIGVPAYLLTTRGIRGFYSIGLLGLFVLGCLLLGTAAYLITAVSFGIPIEIRPPG